ncbi:endonuclease exonuclease phosphatase family [Cryptosporidium sp. chipmunk genotype I]|uniref:endonuclease exonuclease phosphatase family n=1 Tax=Cryptosporidium sp. chipmunk genotype I TaxID=1280935 RepID=UPI00351A5212|nr:endonuclease exonuclease phosphatase family [Cryptosporidium sp. chipmunk genotype I]
MRELSIVSFNVNGLMSFAKRRGYTESTFSKLIDNICVNNEASNASLNVGRPDIICFQECKMSFEEDLNNSIGCPGDYESYFSLADNNKRYSGVATYCLKETAMVVEAARGFSWLESNPSQFDINQVIQTEKLKEIASNISEVKDKYGISISDVDREGRCVITDHKQFVLLNLYVPLLRSKAEEKEEKEEIILKGIQNQNENKGELSETVDPERFRYRLAFQEYLNLLLHVLKYACGRNVILAGDFNIILEKIDCYTDCEGVFDNYKLAPCEVLTPKEVLEISSFGKAYTEIRKMSIEMIKGYCLVDAYRYCYPRVNNKYTCWSQMNQSRIKNQGTRIDLFLISKELVSESIKCEILDHIYGSDHCPILLILNIRESKFESIYNLKKRKPPNICSKYLPQCKQRQCTISQFLVSGKCEIKDQVNKTIKSQDYKINNKVSSNHPQCKHGIPCVKKKVSKSGVNKGRLYWSCPKSDQQKCNTFSWIEETNSGNKANYDLKGFVIR